MAAIDLTGTERNFRMGVNDDIIWAAGPFTADGVVISRAGKRLRFLLKASAAAADVDAIIDIDSVADPTLVFGVGTDAEGTWAIDTRNLITAVGKFRWQIRLSDVASAETDRRGVGKGELEVTYD